MNKLKKSLAMVLAIALLVSLCSFSAFAAEKKYMDFDGIFTLGDSNAMGYGLDGYKGGKVDENGDLISETSYTNQDYLHCVRGSFQDVVRTELGLDWEQTWSMNYPALRVRDALFFLDACDADEYHASAYDYRVQYAERDAYGSKFVYDPSGTIVDNAQSVFISRLQEFDHPLIINQLCSADIFYRPLEEILAKVSANGAEDTSALAKEILSVFWKNHSEFRQNYSLLLQRLQELSPNGVIVLVGMFNPVKDLVAKDNSIVPIFNALQDMIDIINSDIKSLAKKYGCLYADITNVETLTVLNDVSIEDLLSGLFSVEKVYHASPEGYAYIGRQILKQVELDKQHTFTSIKTDLGPVRNVSSVLVDGKPLLLWKYDKATHELTVPYMSIRAKTLTVTEVKEDGSIYLSTYKLHWSLKDGYRATQVYVTLNVANTVAKLRNTVTDAIINVAQLPSQLYQRTIDKLFQ